MMATNEELDQNFGALFCSFFSHDFVRKHLRLAEESVSDLGKITNPPVQPDKETNECTANAERTSISTAVSASVQDESFKTAVSEAVSVVSSNHQESTYVDQPETLTTFIQLVESPKSTNSDEISDETSAADKIDNVSDIEMATSSVQKVISSKAPASGANLLNSVPQAGGSKYFTRKRNKKVNYNDSRLKEVKELKFNHPKQKSSNEPNLRKKIQLRQQKNFVDLTDDDDTDIDMLEEKEDVVNHRSNNRLYNKAKKSYDVEEDNKILKFIIRTNRFADIKGNKLWKDMEAEKVNYPRPWQSMKERFRKIIVPKLSIYGEMFNLNQEAIDTLLNNIEKKQT